MTTHELTWPTKRKSPGIPRVSAGRYDADAVAAGRAHPRVFLRHAVDIRPIRRERLAEPAIEVRGKRVSRRKAPS